jgi:hypothetical protein
MMTRKLENGAKTRTDVAKTPSVNISDDDPVYKNAKKAIKSKADAYVFLAFRYFLPKHCIKCGKKDCYAYEDEKPSVITCMNCENVTKLNKLPIKDHILLAQIIFYYRATNKGIDRIAEIFKVKKSKVLKCIWWGLNSFIDERDRLINHSNRKNFLTNEISYLTLKNRLEYKLTSLRFQARRDSKDN